MSGMTASEFNQKLQRVNRALWVDLSRIAYPYSKLYPTCGLYHYDKFVMGVPQKHVPEWTVAGVDMERMVKQGQDDELKKMLKDGFIPADGSVEEKLMWRGYKAILASLCRQGYISQRKTEKVFRCRIAPRQMEFPRNFIQFPHSKLYLAKQGIL